MNSIFMELKSLDPIGIKPGTHKQQQQQHAQEALSAATAIMPLLAKKTTRWCEAPDKRQGGSIDGGSTRRTAAAPQ